MNLRSTIVRLRRSSFACAAIIIFTVIGRAQTATQQISAFDYIPLEAGARHTYVAVFQRRDAVYPSRDVYSIVTKSVKRDGNDVFYFVEEGQEEKTVQMLDVNMVGLGAYSKQSDGISEANRENARWLPFCKQSMG